MTLSLPLFNPHAGRLGTLLESLPAVGRASGLPESPPRDLRPANSPRPGRPEAGPTPKARATPLPMTMDEARERGYDELDVVIVTGDAYIDHPSFAMAILGRVLEAAGFRVGIVSQPDWRKVDDWRRFGRPRLFFAISAGNMDSMINHYTANRKVRNADAYSPGGRIGLRPDRATLSYCQRAREAYPGVPVIAGGVEASLRRLAHYDYWSDKVRRSILLDCKADLVVYGMGEEAILTIAQRLAAGETVKNLRDMRGVAYVLGASEGVPQWPVNSSKFQVAGCNVGNLEPGTCNLQRTDHSSRTIHDALAETITLPGFEDVARDKLAFAEATRIIHTETNPYNAKRLVQWHDRQAVVANPPAFPISQASMDAIYGLPFTRSAHPSYTEPIPAFEMIKDSVTIMRGCFGGCTFCSITTHQGRTIQSRSKESVLLEIEQMAADPKFKGTVSDIGGPTANMYEMKCTRPEVEANCRRQSCVHPTICKLLGTDHGPLVELMRESREVPGIKKVLVASGIRMDLARRSPEYMRELVKHHVGGHLKVAPEHTDPDVLMKMRKPANDDFEEFTDAFNRESKKAGKKQYIVPYFIASHPASDLEAMIHLAVFLKQNGYRPDQVQDFIPAPFDVATAMYYTGIDPFTKKPVYVARDLKNRKLQRALMQFFKPENYFEVRDALYQAKRTDLIGDGCDSLIPSRPPKEAIEARRRRANQAARGERVEGDHYHTIAGPSAGGKSGQQGQSKGGQNMSGQNMGGPSKGYRPGRKSQGSRPGKKRR
jgi:uncharacterized radical SAM protein YgiQ